jgi:hypothetical protein
MVETTKIHAFTVWDRNIGNNVIGPRLGTPEAIKRVRGKEIDGTRETWISQKSMAMGFTRAEFPSPPKIGSCFAPFNVPSIPTASIR